MLALETGYANDPRFHTGSAPKAPILAKCPSSLLVHIPAGERHFTDFISGSKWFSNLHKELNGSHHICTDGCFYELWYKDRGWGIPRQSLPKSRQAPEITQEALVAPAQTCAELSWHLMQLNRTHQSQDCATLHWSLGEKHQTGTWSKQSSFKVILFSSNESGKGGQKRGDVGSCMPAD